MSDRYHLAQVNIARMLGPLDGPVMAGFVARLDCLNRLADESPGFVWRLQSDEGDATSVRLFDDDMILVNLSVWESVEALRDYVYRSAHASALGKRHEWFGRATEPYLAMWWIPAGGIPTPEEAGAKLEHLRANGPTAEAFTMKEQFPAPTRETVRG